MLLAYQIINYQLSMVFDVVFDVWTCSVLLVVAVHSTSRSSAVGRLEWQLLEQHSPKWHELELPSDKLHKQNKKNWNPEICTINPVVLQVLMPYAPIQVVVCDLSGVFHFLHCVSLTLQASLMQSLTTTQQLNDWMEKPSVCNIKEFFLWLITTSLTW